MSSSSSPSAKPRKPQPLHSSLIAKTLLSSHSVLSPKAGKSPNSSTASSPHFAGFLEKAVSSSGGGGGLHQSRDRSSSAGETQIGSPILRHSWTEEVERNNAGRRRPRPTSLPRSFSSSPDNNNNNEPRTRTNSNGSLDLQHQLVHKRNTSPPATERRISPLFQRDPPSPSTTSSSNGGGDLVIDQTKMLGFGNFGIVYEGTLNRKRVAVKVLKTPDQVSLEKELQTLREIRSTNCVLFLDYFPRKLALVMEYMAGGSLQALLHKGEDKKSVPLSQRLRTKIALDVAEGLVYLHSIPMLHRDLTSGNVLLTRRLDSSGVATVSLDDTIAKISDFGLARKGTTYQSMNTGNLLYVAPEVYDSTAAHSALSDVFSFGILLYEIFSREKPYGDMNPRTAANRAADRDGLRPSHMRTARAEIVPEHILALCEACWKAEPKTRVSSTKAADTVESLLHLMSSCVIASSSKKPRPEEIAAVLQQRGGLGVKYFSGDVRDARATVADTSSVIVLVTVDAFEDDGIAKILAECVVQKKTFLLVVILDEFAPDGTASSLRIAFEYATKRLSPASKFFALLQQRYIGSSGGVTMPIVTWPSSHNQQQQQQKDSGTSFREVSVEVAANQVVRILSDQVGKTAHDDILYEAASACVDAYNAKQRV